MTGVFDYIRWRGDLSFTQDQPNAVDALVFCALAYVKHEGIVREQPDTPVTLREAAQLFFDSGASVDRVRVKNDLELLKAAAASDRFGLSRLCFYRDVYIPEQDTQFAAVSFLLDDGSAFLAFRGTDDSLAGWKEDFNMSFQQTVASQRLAQQYTREFAAEYMMPIRMCGHSKGGNLAVFAAARSSPMIQKRILEVYNNDGPGFTDYLMGDPGYIAMVPKIRTFVPQSSVIGMLLEHEEPYTVIHSSQVSLLQHELYSWEVVGKHFVPMEQTTENSRFLNQTIKNWIAEMPLQDRNILVDTLFDLLGSGDVESATDIFHPKNIRIYLRALSTDGNIRKILTEELYSLLSAAKKAKDQFSDIKRLQTTE